ncbi:MAG TPA: ShlB/FhaC/HecB family hemolysin secretion/activation protein [Chlamydiales bacterium]|jgi:hemolysin activation/secretion protein
MKWIWMAFICIGVAYATPPPVPSAGIIERELEKEYEATPLEPKKELPDVQIDIPEEKLEIPEGTSLEVKEVEIQGNEAISCEEIEKWVEGFLGEELTLKDIYALCQAIDRGYAKRGYFLARAYPPPQTVEGGVLRIEVLEGRLGEVHIEPGKFYSERFVGSYFEALQGKGLNYDQFMRALLLLNENSDLQAGAVFAKGKEVGTADVTIKVKDARPIHLYLNGNNYGRDITTNFRLGGRVDAGSLFLYGDKLSVAEVVGFPVNALYFTDVVYRAPVNRKGTFVELAYLFSKFHVEEQLDLQLKGRSDIGTAKVSHAVHRSREMSVDIFGYFDVKQIQNFVLGSRTSFDKLRVATWGYTLDRFSKKDQRHFLNARVAVGIPDFLGGLSSVDSECSRVGAGGLFLKFNGDYDWLQTFKQDCVFSFHGSGQWSSYKLPIPEQIYIGGVDTVRGFPLACVLGDSGYYWNAELRVPPPLLANQRFFVAHKKWKEVVQLVAFLDNGGVFFHGGSNTFLWGSGIGFRFRGLGNMSLSVDLGFPLNHKGFSSGAFMYLKVAGQAF